MDVISETETDGVRAWHVEGQESRRWVLVDFVDVVVHVFHERTREFYRAQWKQGNAQAMLRAETGKRRGTLLVYRGNFEEEIYRVR